MVRLITSRFSAGLALAISISQAVACGGAGDDGGDPAPALTCRVSIAKGNGLTEAVIVSSPENSAMSPVIAAGAGHVLVAWHEFVNDTTALVYTVIRDGCVGELRPIPETLAAPRNATVASTGDGYVIAYDAADGELRVVRSVRTNDDGEVLQGPETISAPGQAASSPSVVAKGEDVAFAWTDGTSHFFRITGPLEDVSATPVGTELTAQDARNAPKLARGADGKLFIAFRDGGSMPKDWDIMIAERQVAGSFGPPLNVSNSRDRLSDEVALAVQDNGELMVVWVEETATAFEVYHAVRQTDGSFSFVSPIATQNLWANKPSAAAGMAAVWNEGTLGTGPFFLSLPPAALTPILGDITGTRAALTRDPNGRLHLVVNIVAEARKVGYAWRD